MRAWTRLRAYAGVWTLVGLLGVAAVYLAAATAPMSREFEDQALRQLVAASPSLVRDITVAEPAAFFPTTAEGMRSQVGALLPSELAGAAETGWGIQRTQVRRPAPGSPGLSASVSGEGVVTDPAGLLPLAALHHQSDLASEVAPATEEVTDPAAAVVEVMAAQPVADALGLRVGESYPLLLAVAPIAPDRAAEVDAPRLVVELTGIFSPLDPTGPVWEPDPRLLEPSERLWPHAGDQVPLRQGTLVTDQPGIDALFALGLNRFFEVENVARFRLDESRLDARWATGVRAAVGALTTDPQLRRSMRVQTGLAGLADDFLRRAAAARAVVAVVAAGLVGTVVGLLVIAARVAADRRRAELTLLRARGGSVLGVVGRVTAEALVVMPPAIAAGWLLHLPLPGRADPAALLGIGIAPMAAAAVAVLAVPVAVAVLAVAVLAVAGTGGRRWRRPRSGLVRVTSELLVLVLAGLGVLLLHQRGLDRAGTDPYLSTVPLLLGVAAGLLALRLYRWPLRVLGALAARRPGAVGFLGLARAGRAAPAAALPLLLMVLAVAMGGFAGAVYASVEDARDTAALHMVGADIRVDSTRVTDQVVAAVAAVPGVVEVAPARRDGGLRDGRRTVPGAAVLIVDAPAYQRVLINLGTAARLPDAFVSASPGTAPLPVLASPRLAGGELRLDIDGQVRPAVVVGDVAGLPGMERVENRLLVPREAVGGSAEADQLLIAGPEADPAAVRAAVEHSTGLTGAEVVVTSRAEQRAQLATSGFNRGLTLAFVAAAAGAAVGGLLALGLALAVEVAARGRALSLLRTMGMSAPQARRMLLVELVPVVALAVALGATAGVVMPVLLAPALGLTEFTGGAPVPIGLDPRTVLLLAGLLAAFVVGAALAEAAMNRRLGLGQLLRVDG